jgi:hypothetical protein
MRKLIRVALCLLTLPVGICTPRVKTSDNANPSVLWKRVVLQDNDHGPRILRPSDQFAKVTFLDDERIVISEEVPTGALSARDSASPENAFVLKVQLLNAVTGAGAASLSLPTRRAQSSAQGVAGGLLIRAGSTLRLYSAEMKQVSEISLPQDSSDDKWTVMVSNSRRTVLLRHYDSTHNQFTFVDAATWQVRRKWDDRPAWRPIQLPYSASDVALARADSNQQNILYSDFGSAEWRALSPSPARVGCVTFPGWADSVSLVNAGCEFFLISTTGNVLMRIAPPKHWSFDGKVGLSQNSRYAAVKQDTGQGGGFWDTDVRWTATRIVVFDLSLKKPVLSLNVAPLPRDNYDFALSPDGSKLAVLNDGTLSVYSVPGSN